MNEIELLNLLNQNHEYLHFQVRNILRKNPRLCRWIQADDVAQNILIRMYRCIKDEKMEIFDQQHFVRLMSTQLRREVIDLYRKHFGPYGMGTQLKTDPHSEEYQPARHIPDLSQTKSGRNFTRKSINCQPN
jgi:DNA-directed RNA polymerase specialized sigma24 family protein